MISTTRASLRGGGGGEEPLLRLPGAGGRAPGTVSGVPSLVPPHEGSRLLFPTAGVFRVRQVDAIISTGDGGEFHPPPWTCAVRALGHTFGHVGATIGFMPKCHFTARGHRLLFPPTVKGDYSYQTLALVNDGDTAVGFEFPSKRVSDVAIELGGSPFSCFPTKGVVDPRSFTLVTFRFDARDVEAHREILTCALNGSTENAVALDVRAQGHVPKLKVGFDNSFVFKPTCVGAVTARDVDVTNLSRINVLYEWDIPRSWRRPSRWSRTRG